MANQEHVDRLLQGVKDWNYWRQKNLQIIPDLSSANFEGADLGRAYLNHSDLSFANFSNTYLKGAILYSAILRNAILRNAILSFADLRDADLRSANLRSANLSRTDLRSANLRSVNLRSADLWKSDLSSTDLSNADLSDADLSFADLRDADLKGANLSDADLRAVQALGTDFQAAILTGAAIQNWNINSETNLQDVVCTYIFRGYNSGDSQFTDRLPHDLTKDFAPGDFAKLVQESLNTVSLIFREGLDWRSFSYSFQQLRVQYADEQIAIQSIENKGDGTVIVRLAVSPNVNKGSFEQFFWRGFEMAQKTVAGQYEARLEDKDKHINQLFTLLQQSQEKLGEVPKIMAENPKYDLRGAKFGGGFAAEGSTQIGGTLNDFSQHIEQHKDEIALLITSLRRNAETFPQEKQEEVLVHLEDLEEDIQQPEKRKPNRIKARLAALLTIAVGVGGAVTTVTDFTNNVLELSEKLGVPIEQVQPQFQQPDPIDVNAIEPDHP